MVQSMVVGAFAGLALSMCCFSFLMQGQRITGMNPTGIFMSMATGAVIGLIFHALFGGGKGDDAGNHKKN